MTTLDLCEKYFGSRDVYKLLDISKDAAPKDIKKAYYKLSLQVHPDRVIDSEKKSATEKFKILSKIYQVLSDKDKRAIYDKQGIIDDEDDMESKLTSWLELWRKIFKPLTIEDISNYQKSYINSELERNDMKKAYISGKGCINHIMNEVPFLQVEDEPRLQVIIKKMIADNEVPDYKIFTKEPAQKRNRRHKKYAREFKEAEKIKEKLIAENDGKSLEQTIIARQKSRANDFSSLMDRLEEQYGDDDDDSEVIDFKKLDKPKKKKSSNRQQTSSKGNLRSVKSGKVNKKR